MEESDIKEQTVISVIEDILQNTMALYVYHCRQAGERKAFSDALDDLKRMALQLWDNSPDGTTINPDGTNVVKH